MKRKRIVFIGPPFSGHLHPLLGIAQRVSEVAAVEVWSTPGVARSCEMPFRAILSEHEKEVWEIAEPGTGVKNNPLLLYRQLRQNVALMGQMKRELDAALSESRPDLVIADFTVPVAGLAAQKLGIEWWTTLTSPCVFETPDGPPAYFGGQTPAGHPLKHAAMRQATRCFKKLMWRLFRREFREIGFECLYRADGSEAVYSPQRILALGMREIEFPRTYPPHMHFVGPVLHTPPHAGEVPPFVTGKPHVLVSLGTHLPHAKAMMAAAVREIAQRQPGIVFHFTHGCELAVIRGEAANYQELAYVSYAEHLPRYDVVVHHAGAGVMNHCLRHGVPAVVHPLDFDQFDNTARLVAAGVALSARKTHELEPAILRALTDTELRGRCEAMSRVVAGYDAPGKIAEMVAMERNAFTSGLVGRGIDD